MVPDSSNLSFAATWEDSTFTGRFVHFDADIIFDPNVLPDGRFDVRVDVTSAVTGSRDRDEGMADPDWFDFQRYSEAKYLAKGFESLGDDRYLASGVLKLKGVSRPVPVNFSWEVTPTGALLQGSALVNRLDFGIGEGDWATGDIIGLVVNVTFSLELFTCAGS
jgi:polyisoprenoid-binding protein YceI